MGQSYLLASFPLLTLSASTHPLSPQANPNELTNGVINSAFMLLFKDSIRLFAAYNEGVINLLGNTHACKQTNTILSEPVQCWPVVVVVQLKLYPLRWQWM